MNVWWLMKPDVPMGININPRIENDTVISQIEFLDYGIKSMMETFFKNRILAP
jgi:hypothetical protein